MTTTLPHGETTRLFWTGGWDSTFQLLRLLLIHRRRVQPYYLIDSRRPSIRHEVKAMHRIKQRLYTDHPHTRELLAAGEYMAVEDVAPDADITGAYRSLSRRHYVADQYEWLARFCKQRGLTDVQLCVHINGGVAELIGDMLRRRETPYGLTHRIDAASADARAAELFGRFSMPLLDISKRDMVEVARQHGWMGIMHRTWFCHVPLPSRKPCGVCYACTYTIEHGMGWRIPRRRRVLAFLRRCVGRVGPPPVGRLSSDAPDAAPQDRAAGTT